MNSWLGTSNLTLHAGDKCICQGVSLSVLPGQTLVIMGANGVGKSTLLRTLAGLSPPGQGEVLLTDQPMGHFSRRQIARQMGVLFQEPPPPGFASVWETALLGRHPHLSPWREPGEKEHAMVWEALAVTGLTDLAQRPARTLSSGERKRLEIALLLVQDPPLLLLDEPVNHLDWRHQILLLDHLGKRTKNQGGALVMILHDLNLAARYGDSFLFLLGEGRVQMGGAADLFTPRGLEELFGLPIHHLVSPTAEAWIPAHSLRN